MYWFQHPSDHLSDPFQQALLHKFGAKGYLIYWGILSLIARDSESGFLTGKGTFSKRFLKQMLHLHPKKIVEVLSFCEAEGELEFSVFEKDIFVNIPKLMEILSRAEKNMQAKIKRLAGKGDHSNDEENNISSNDMELALLMLNKICAFQPGFKRPDMEAWENEIGKIVEEDKKSHMEIQGLFMFARDKDYWLPIILSPMDLRKNWDRLEGQMLIDEKKRGDNKNTTFYSDIREEIEAKKKAKEKADEKARLKAERKDPPRTELK